MEKELWFDVLVIGGGGAALRAALSASEEGVKTAILCKKNAGKSGATYYSVAEVGAFNVPDGAMDPEDNPEKFNEDMKNASLGMASLPLCKLLAEKAQDALEDLEEMSNGGVFSKIENGDFNVYQACFSTRPRSHVVENHFKPILKALRDEIGKKDITVLNNMQAVELLLSDGQIGGVLALDEQEQVILLHAKSVILATGGASQLFKRNMYPADITGDGYAMAYRVGATLCNMEFIQAGIGVAHPFINLFGNYLWEAYPHIRNVEGEDILLKYGGSLEAEKLALEEKTHFPFSTRDASKLIEIAVQTEINEGRGTENGNVYLDFLDTDFEKLFKENPVFASMWEFTYKWHLEKGIDFYKQPIEIACFAHAINGGVLIDENASTDIPGLFAAGETAAGPHGADRLGGNMSVTCQVFGKIAGSYAAQRAKSMNEFPCVDLVAKSVKDSLTKRVSGEKLNSETLLEELQAKTDKALLIVRDQEHLQEYLGYLEQLKGILQNGCCEGRIGKMLQLENLVTTGAIIATAALKRTESRGSHYRADYPDMNPEMGKRLLVGSCAGAPHWKWDD